MNQQEEPSERLERITDEFMDKVVARLDSLDAQFPNHYTYTPSEIYIPSEAEEPLEPAEPEELHEMPTPVDPPSSNKLEETNPPEERNERILRITNTFMDRMLTRIENLDVDALTFADIPLWLIAAHILQQFAMLGPSDDERLIGALELFLRYERDSRSMQDT